ncbi:MAG: cupin domain-containing protein [bacterium]|nr:cupin domain-containing protein [bacterium]
MSEMQVHNWNEIEPHHNSGRVQRVISGENITVLRQTIPAGTPLRPHSHPHEQMTIVFGGRARFTCEGKSVELGPGGIVVLPPDKEHMTENIGDGELVCEEIFAPVREELARMAAPSAL